MPSAYLKTRLEDRARMSDLITATLDKAAADHRDVNPEEKKLLDDWEGRAATLDDELKRLETIERGNHSFDAMIGRLGREDEQEGRRRTTEKPEPETRAKSTGEQFVESDAFKNYDGHGSSKPVDFGGFIETRAAITTGDLDIPATQWDGPTGPTYTAPLLNVIGREPVSTGSVEFTVWGEASDAQIVAEGGIKPEADLSSKPDSATLETYAHWKGVTRQALEDYPRIRTIVETKLRRGLTNALQTGAADALEAAAFGTSEQLPEGLSPSIRAAMGILEGNGYTPNAVLLSPTTFAQLDISAAAAANNGPVAFGTYWGLRPIPVKTIPDNTAYVGDFQEALTWFDRNVTSVYLTDSHADNFVRNILIILAETRAKFVATDLMAAIKIAPPAVEGSAAKASK